MLKQKNLEELLLKIGYSAKAAKLCLNKVNVSSIKHPDVASTFTGLICGDTITLYLKLENKTIKNAKFQHNGCAGTASSGSALTNLIIDKTIKEAEKLTKDDVLRELEGLPESHCAELAINALHKSLEKLEEKSRRM
jgi:NifU-like protein involved in Fe-S cluster formation